MPGLDGIEATRRIVAAAAAARVLILTTFDLDEYVFAALRAGASGFLLKDAPPAPLLTAIRVRRRRRPARAGVTRRLIEEYARRPARPVRPRRTLDGLTEREVEVLRRWPPGCPTPRSPSACTSARPPSRPTCQPAARSSALRDRAQPVVLAYEAGLVSPQPP